MADKGPGDRTRTFGRSGDGGADPRGGTPSGGRGASADASARGRQDPAAQSSRIPWVALGVAALLGLWQVIFALTVNTVDPASQDVYTSVALFVSLILAVSAVVLGAVGLSQRHRPRWPSTSATAIGTYVFIVTVATWVGGLMATPA